MTSRRPLNRPILSALAAVFLFAAAAFAWLAMGVTADAAWVSGLLGVSAVYLNHVRMRQGGARWRGLKSVWVATAFLVVLAAGQLIKDNREGAMESASAIVVPVVALIVAIVSVVTVVTLIVRR